MVDNNLKKEVDLLLSQGYSVAQIKQALTQKGYTIAQIEEAMNYKGKPRQRIGPKTKIVGAAVIVLIILLTTLYLINSKPKFVDYTSNPDDWVITNENGTKDIDVSLATGGKSFIDEQGQQYRDDDIITVFSSYGYYEGEYFNSEYYNSFGRRIMSLNNNMAPGDGVIEGYAVFNIVNDSPVYYIFIDEDWKQKIVPTMIYYGFEHTKNKTFEFKEISEGIYMDQITDDKDNYDESYKIHTGSILVGDITSEKISSGSNNLTMLIIK